MNGYFSNYSFIARIMSKGNVGKIFFTILLTFLIIAANLALPFLFMRSIDLLAEINSAISVETMPLLAIALFGLAWTLTLGLSKIREMIVTPIKASTASNLAENIASHYLDQSYAYHAKNDVSVVSKYFMHAFNSIPNVVSSSLLDIIPTILEALISSALLTYFFGYAGLSPVVILSVYLPLTLIGGRITYNLQQSKSGAMITTWNYLNFMLSNYENIHYFNNKDHEITQLHRVHERYNSISNKSVNVPNLITFFLNTLVGIMFTAVVTGLGYFVGFKNYDINDFILISFYLLQFATPLSRLSDALNKHIEAVVDLKTITDFLRLESSITNSPNARPLVRSQNTAEVKFQNVSFTHQLDDQQEQRPALSNITFTIPAGKKTAIVGMSGAGKSTIGKLLFRFYDPASGTILINDQDIRSVTQHSLRAAVAIVPQTPIIFNGTLEDNIRYGNLRATSKMLQNVIRRAGLQEYINAQPQGLKTSVGQQGLQLSGGQRQRIAIARALLKNPSIYVLDEHTAALDFQTETEVQNHLDKILKNKTTLLITHKLATVTNADNIIMLEQGQIVEQGSFRELMHEDSAGHFKQMFTTYCSENRISIDQLVPPNEEAARYAFNLSSSKHTNTTSTSSSSNSHISINSPSSTDSDEEERDEEEIDVHSVITITGFQEDDPLLEREQGRCFIL